MSFSASVTSSFVRQYVYGCVYIFRERGALQVDARYVSSGGLFSIVRALECKMTSSVCSKPC